MYRILAVLLAFYPLLSFAQAKESPSKSFPASKDKIELSQKKKFSREENSFALKSKPLVWSTSDAVLLHKQAPQIPKTLTANYTSNTTTQSISLEETEQLKVPLYKKGISFGLSFGTTFASGVVFSVTGLLSLATDAKREVILPVMLFSGTGFLIGPSAGHFYSGDTRHALIFSGLRFASAITLASFLTCSDGSSVCRSLVASSSIALAGLTLYDILDSFAAPERVAQQRGEKALSIHPAPMIGPDGKQGAGLFVSGAF